ncbi:unnamed protein product [Lampetra fluviatilis]
MLKVKRVASVRRQSWRREECGGDGSSETSPQSSEPAAWRQQQLGRGGVGGSCRKWREWRGGGKHLSSSRKSPSDNSSNNNNSDCEQQQQENRSTVTAGVVLSRPARQTALPGFRCLRVASRRHLSRARPSSKPTEPREPRSLPCGGGPPATGNGHSRPRVADLRGRSRDATRSPETALLARGRRDEEFGAEGAEEAGAGGEEKWRGTINSLLNG